MGNAGSKCRPCICLLKQLLKKGKHKPSEKRLEELLKVIETHCSWFQDLGTLDIDKWEEVGQGLRELHSNRVSFPGSSWETFKLIRSVLELLLTDSEEEREKDDIDQFKKTKGVIVHTGIIDPDFKGEIQIVMSSSVPWSAKKRERVAQLLLIPYTPRKKRGTQKRTGGFGSTGSAGTFLAEKISDIRPVCQVKIHNKKVLRSMPASGGR